MRIVVVLSNITDKPNSKADSLSTYIGRRIALEHLVVELEAATDNSLSKANRLSYLWHLGSTVISDFDLYCHIAKYRQYSLVFIVDSEDDIWLGDEADIFSNNYFAYGSAIKVYR